MKFVVSSSELLSHLQAISKVISTKNTMPILDNYLFTLEGSELIIKASDLESTMITTLTMENIDGEGSIAIPAKLLNDTLKEFPEQPLTFEIDTENSLIEILSETGKYSIPGMDGEDYPQTPTLNEKASSISLDSDILAKGISKTLFATADDEIRPVMNGIFVQISPESITFVASDSHKLVRYRRFDAHGDQSTGFILPKKPATLIRNIVDKIDAPVVLMFDEKNAYIKTSGFQLICRLIEGEYPKYESVIPTNNPNKMIIDRSTFSNTLKRISVFSSQSSNLVKLGLNSSFVLVSAQDIDFSISAYERISSQYEGEEMEIGFKSSFLIEILNNLSVNEVVMELAEPSRAVILLPFQNVNQSEDVLMLLMPMML